MDGWFRFSPSLSHYGFFCYRGHKLCFPTECLSVLSIKISKDNNNNNKNMVFENRKKIAQRSAKAFFFATNIIKLNISTKIRFRKTKQQKK